MSRQEEFGGTTQVRVAHRFDETRLDAWMQTNVRGYAGPLAVEQFKGGQSNPTYRLVTPNATYVLRRKPPGQLLKGAHAVEREAQVLTALRSVGFPVPRVHGLCSDDGVIGTWFYVMDHIDGRIFWDVTLPEVNREVRPRYFDAMNEALAQLHSIDYAAIGLANYGRPGNYFERQIARWSKQYVTDVEAGRDPHMDRLIEWLPAHVPSGDETTIVHGDFRIDNVIFHPSEPRILAVLDWELSTLGHPLADFAYHAMTWRVTADEFRGIKGVDLASLGIPDEAAYVAAYCARTGREAIDDWDYYLAFNMFRMAAILQGILARAIQGNATSSEAVATGRRARPMAAAGWRLVEGLSAGPTATAAGAVRP